FAWEFVTKVLRLREKTAKGKLRLTVISRRSRGLIEPCSGDGTLPRPKRLLPKRNDRETSALSLRERAERRAKRGARVREFLAPDFPHPRFAHPLPRGSGPRSKMILVGQQPWLGSFAVPQLQSDRPLHANFRIRPSPAFLKFLSLSSIGR